MILRTEEENHKTQRMILHTGYLVNDDRHRHTVYYVLFALGHTKA